MPESKPRPPLPHGPYLVVGLARSGQAAARLLAGRGERVIGVDAGSPDGAAGLAGAGVEVILDVDGVEALERVQCVIKSPGVPASAPVVAAARKRGLEVLGELELAWRLIPNRFCAVTGTNGKTTVTELLGHVWRTAGEPVAVAGNVGTPLSSLVDELGPDATVICEASSFQLEDADAFAPECAVLLNVTADHLDRHGTLEAYRAAKLRAFAHQGPDDFALLNGSDPNLVGVQPPGEARRLWFCRRDAAGERTAEGCDAEVTDAELRLAGETLLELSELSLLGPHNADNAAAAALAADAMGIERERIAAALRSFAGVRHRLQRVAEIDGVTYVNDSKATNPAAAAAALDAFEGGVHVLLGGSLKGGGFAELAAPVAASAKAAYLYGEAAPALEADLQPAWERGVAHARFDDLAGAFAAAVAAARPGEVVLLAPACASFDAYRDFEDRGEHFVRLVEGLR